MICRVEAVLWFYHWHLLHGQVVQDCQRFDFTQCFRSRAGICELAYCAKQPSNVNVKDSCLRSCAIHVCILSEARAESCKGGNPFKSFRRHLQHKKICDIVAVKLPMRAGKHDASVIDGTVHFTNPIQLFNRLLSEHRHLIFGSTTVAELKSFWTRRCLGNCVSRLLCSCVNLRRLPCSRILHKMFAQLQSSQPD